MDDDRGVAVDDPVLDLALEVAPGDVDGAGQGALLVLVGLSHVEHHGAVADGIFGGAGVDLADADLGLVEQIAVAGHSESLPARSGFTMQWPGPLDTR